MVRERVIVDITSATIFRIILICLFFWFLYLIIDILLMLVAAIIMAAAMEPLVNYGQRYRIPRPLSVGGLYILLLLLLFSGVSLLIQPLTAQITDLALAVPTLISRLDILSAILPNFDQTALTEGIQTGLLRLGGNLTNVGASVVQQTRTLFSTVFTVIFVFVIALYLVIERDALKKFARLVTPRAHLPYVEQGIDRAQHNIGKWVVAQLSLGLIVGVLVGVGLWAIGIKYALVLGLLAGILEIIPVIGPIMAAIPGVVIGLSHSFTFGVIALGFYIAVQLLENNVLIPSIMRKAIGLNPLVTILAVLLGARLAGIGGAILAIPIATILGVFVSDIFLAPLPDDELAG